MNSALGKFRLEEPPDEEGPWHLAYLMQGRADDAVRVYKELAARHPRDPESWTLLGIALRQAKDVNGARTAFEKALEISPSFSKAVELLAELDIDAGDFNSALARAAKLSDQATNRVDGLLNKRLERVARHLVLTGARP